MMARGDGFQNMARWFDGLYWDCPDYPVAVVALIDALRGYIRCDEELEKDAVLEGWVVSQEATRKWRAHMQLVRLLLRELEAREVDPSLGGQIRWKPEGG